MIAQIIILFERNINIYLLLLILEMKCEKFSLSPNNTIIWLFSDISFSLKIFITFSSINKSFYSSM